MQNIVSKIIMGTAIIVFSIILNSKPTSAQDCVPNDCQAMGYTKTAATCAGVDFIKCPFDTSKVFCHKEVCIGFEKGTPNCKDGQTVEYCSDDNRYYKCNGTPCELGYATLFRVCDRDSSCLQTQNSNKKCARCIYNGGCKVSLMVCPIGSGLGKRPKCTNACGEVSYECCSADNSSTGFNDCLLSFDPNIPPALAD